MRKVVWGVLSTARIGTEKVIPAMQRSGCCEVRAIASRSLPKAQEAAGKLGIPVAYGSYEALLADPAIEAVYNPLPNDQHVGPTLAAVAAGKHVLCEKPFALTAPEAARLRGLPPGILVSEAFMVRYHPQWLRVRELVRAGRVGTVRAVQVFFSFFNEDGGNIRNQPAAGGGAVYDIGCYADVVGRFVYEAEPVRAIALVDRDPRFGTDRTTSALVDFGGGRHLGYTVSTQAVRFQRVQVVGTTGRIEVEIPFNAPQGEAVRIRLDDGRALDGSTIQVETVPACDQYELQALAFCRAVRGEAPLPYGVEDAVRNMQLIDALFRSEKSGRWEVP